MDGVAEDGMATGFGAATTVAVATMLLVAPTALLVATTVAVAPMLLAASTPPVADGAAVASTAAADMAAVTGGSLQGAKD